MAACGAPMPLERVTRKGKEEQDPLALQAQHIKDHKRCDKGDPNCKDQLLQHLGRKVCNRMVQPIIALPAAAAVSIHSHHQRHIPRELNLETWQHCARQTQLQAHCHAGPTCCMQACKQLNAGSTHTC